MPTYSETQASRYSPRQLYDMVIDVERYPDFLPWCRAARILEKNGDYMLAELVISFKHLTESYVSKVSGKPPQPGEAGHIDVEMVKGPFEKLINRWDFTPADGGSSIEFFLDFKFKSKLMEMMIGSVFTTASAKMVTAFRDRAEMLYGAGK